MVKTVAKTVSKTVAETSKLHLKAQKAPTLFKKLQPTVFNCLLRNAQVKSSQMSKFGPILSHWSLTTLITFDLICYNLFQLKASLHVRLDCPILQLDAVSN